MWDENAIREVRLDYPLLITVVLLAGLGLTMVFSSSAVLAQEKFGGGLYFLKRMIFHAGLGFCLMTLFSKIPYVQLRRLVYPLLFLSLLLMALTVFSGWGVRVGGAKRWMNFGFLVFQPSEFAKIALVLFLAYSMERKSEKMGQFSIGVLPNIVIAGIVILLVLAGRDLGGAFVMGICSLLLLYLGGARVIHLVFLALAALPFLYHLIVQEGYRLKRVLTFLNPWEDRYGSGFQIIQSFLAFNEGGVLGKGLGAGQQKLFYLPEAHTDFIFSVLGEELGLVGVLMTIGLFLFLGYRGIRIASLAPDLFGRYLAEGFVAIIAGQGLLNMAVVMGLLPTKGLVLPLIGYGGSALVTTLIMIGILLNISTHQRANMPLMMRQGQKPFRKKRMDEE